MLINRASSNAASLDAYTRHEMSESGVTKLTITAHIAPFPTEWQGHEQGATPSRANKRLTSGAGINESLFELENKILTDDIHALLVRGCGETVVVSCLVLKHVCCTIGRTVKQTCSLL